MHPSLISFDKTNRNNKKRDREDWARKWLDDICITLSNGDVLKRDEIAWGFTLEEVNPYIEYRLRNILFREAVLSFLGVKTEKQVEDEYCEVCRAAGKDVDCANCSKEIKVEKEQERKAIG